jgi:hypothetical protein
VYFDEEFFRIFGSFPRLSSTKINPPKQNCCEGRHKTIIVQPLLQLVPFCILFRRSHPCTSGKVAAAFSNASRPTEM